MQEKEKRLIVNADDFGIHEAVNWGILVGYQKGCITSASLMAGGDAFCQAVEIVKNHQIPVGVHLTMVAGNPVSLPGRIPSLLTSTGRFFSGHSLFIKEFLLGRISMKEIRLELMAQIEHILSRGIAIDHIDSHQHLHVLPGIIDIVLDLAQKYDIHRIRIPDEGYFFTGGYPVKAGRFLGRGGLAFLARRARRKSLKAGFIVPDSFFGMLAGGNMREEYFINILKSLPWGLSEIMIHPGIDNVVLQKEAPGYHWEEELAAVCSGLTKEVLKEEKITLQDFSGNDKCE